MPRVPVRVRTGERTFVIGDGMIAALPVTIRTAMVSPMARPMPRMIAAVIPENAAGTTTCRIVCHRVAPRASDPSRNSRGTLLIASSETEMIVGRAMIPSRIEPASIDSPDGASNVTRSHSTRTTRPKNP
ncbi:hypothetical protein DSECCO2_565740 [anaerobic digester metagenome]